eukprot:gene17049-23342_t
MPSPSTTPSSAAPPYQDSKGPRGISSPQVGIGRASGTLLGKFYDEEFLGKLDEPAYLAGDLAMSTQQSTTPSLAISLSSAASLTTIVPSAVEGGSPALPTTNVFFAAKEGNPASPTTNASFAAEGGSPVSPTTNVLFAAEWCSLASPTTIVLFAAEGGNPASPSTNMLFAAEGGSPASPASNASLAKEGGRYEASVVESPAGADEAGIEADIEAEGHGSDLDSGSDDPLLFYEEGTCVPTWLSTIDEVSEDCHDTASHASYPDTDSLASLIEDASPACSRGTSGLSSTSPPNINDLLNPPGTSPPKINSLLDFYDNSPPGSPLPAGWRSMAPPPGSSLPLAALNVAYPPGQLDADGLKNPKWVTAFTEQDRSSPMGPVEVLAWACSSPDAGAVREAYPGR